MIFPTTLSVHEINLYDVFNLSVLALQKENKDYYRELADFLYKKCSFFPVFISVKNTGNSKSENVRIEITINNIDVFDILKEYQIPNDNDLPKKTIDHAYKISKFIIRTSIDTKWYVSKSSNSYHIEIEYQHIQGGKNDLLRTFFYLKKSIGKNYNKWNSFFTIRT